MPDYIFERQCRTPYSEAYLISQDDEHVGRVDLHYTPSTVYALLAVENGTTEDDILNLIEEIDDQLVASADVPREDFVVTVYRGVEVGVYSDEGFEEDEEEEEGDDHA